MKRTSRVLGAGGSVVLAAILASCAFDRLPTAPGGSDAAAHTTRGLERAASLSGGVLTCRPASFARDSMIIGPHGGVLRVGNHSLIVPPRALERAVLITAEVPGDATASVRLFPEGLTFQRTAMLSLTYARCARPEAAPLRIYYVNEALEVLETIPASDQPGSARIVGRIGHFSRYAVGW